MSDRDLSELSTLQLLSVLENLGPDWTDFRDDVIAELSKRMFCDWNRAVIEQTKKRQKPVG